MAKTAKGTGADNRQKIIDAAVELITDKGVKKTSLAEIAKKTGLSKGTIYYYFASKNDLIFDITELHMEKITGEIFSMIDENKDVTMKMLLERLFETLLASVTRTRLHLFLIREAVSGNLSIKERFQKTYQEWFAKVIDAYDQLGIKSEDKNLKSQILVAVLDGMIIQTLFEVEPPDSKKIARQMLKIIDPT